MTSSVGCATVRGARLKFSIPVRCSPASIRFCFFRSNRTTIARNARAAWNRANWTVRADCGRDRPMPIVNHSLKGKVGMITGGSKGIGRAIALAFAEHCADVALVARGLEALDAVRAEVEATGQRCLAIPADMAEV